jgi:hypothetical protein
VRGVYEDRDRAKDILYRHTLHILVCVRTCVCVCVCVSALWEGKLKTDFDRRKDRILIGRGSVKPSKKESVERPPARVLICGLFLKEICSRRPIAPSSVKLKTMY